MATPMKKMPVRTPRSVRKIAQNENSQDEGIVVAIRMRPLNNTEGGHSRVWKVLPKFSSVTQTTNTGQPLPERVVGRTFYSFDKTFGEETSTASVYDSVAKEIVSSAVKGLNGTIFAYGQTSSGKTYTMQGSGSIKDGSEGSGGVVHMAARDVFDQIKNTPDRTFMVRASFLEIYNEEVRDLLSETNQVLQIREDVKRGIFVQSREGVVTDFDSLLEILFQGEKSRAFASTAMNERSSRSHTIFRITIESQQKNVGQDVGEEQDRVRDSAILISTLNLVDLAGSESVRHTGATGNRQKEGGMINTSLLTLSRVIVALGTPNQSHINFRDSKLTRLLQPSLCGNARMAVICCATPSELYLEETRSTLLFASRAKLVKTKAIVNEIVDDRSLIQRLKRELAVAKGCIKHIQTQNERAAEAGVITKEAENQLQRLKDSILNNKFFGSRKQTLEYDSFVSSPKQDCKRRRLSHGTISVSRSLYTPEKDSVTQRSPKTTSPPMKKIKIHRQSHFSPRAELELLRQAISSKKGVVHCMKDKFSKLRCTEIEALEKDLLILKNKNNVLQNQLNVVQRKNNDGVSELARVKAENEQNRLEKEKNENALLLQRSAESIKKELMIAKEEIAAATAEKNDAITQINTISKENQKALYSMNTMEKTLRETENTIGILQESITELRADKSEKTLTVEENTSGELSTKELQEAHITIEGLRSDLNDLQLQKKALYDKSALNEKRSNFLMERVKIRDNSIAEMAIELNVAKENLLDKSTGADNENKKVPSSVNYVDQVGQLQQVIHDLELEKENTVYKITDLNNEINSITKDNDKTKECNNSLKKKLEDLQSENNEKEKRVNSLNNKMKWLEEEKMALLDRSSLLEGKTSDKQIEEKVVAVKENKMISSLKTELQASQSTIQGLRSGLNDLQLQNKSLSDKVALNEKRNKFLIGRVEIRDRTFADMTMELNTAKEKLAVEVADKDRAYTQMKIVSENCQEANMAIVVAKESLTDANNKIKGFEKVISCLQSEKEALIGKISGLNIEIDSIKEEFNKMNSHNELLIHELQESKTSHSDEIKSQNNNVKTELTSLKKEKKTVIERSLVLQKNADDMQATLTTTQEKLIAVTAEKNRMIDSLKVELHNLHNTSEGQQSDLKNAQQQMIILNEQLLTSQKEKTSLIERVEVLDCSIIDMTSELITVKENLLAAFSDKDDACAQIRIISQERQEAIDSVETTKNAIYDGNSKIDALEKTISNLQSEKDASICKVNNLKSEIELINKEHDKMKESVESLMFQLEESKATSQLLRSERDSIDSQKNIVNSEVTSLKEENTTLLENTSLFEKKFVDMESELKFTQERVAVLTMEKENTMESKKVELENHHATIEGLHSDLNDLQKLKNNINDKLLSNEEENKILLDKIEILNRTVVDSTSELCVVKKKLFAETAEKENARTQTQNVSQECRKAITSMDATQELLNDASNKIVQLEQVITSLQSEKETSICNLNDLKNEINTMTGNYQKENVSESRKIGDEKIEGLDYLKVVEIRKMLKERGLPTGGKKAELLSSLRNSLREEETSEMDIDQQDHPNDTYTETQIISHIRQEAMSLLDEKKELLDSANIKIEQLEQVVCGLESENEVGEDRESLLARLEQSKMETENLRSEKDVIESQISSLNTELVTLKEEKAVMNTQDEDVVDSLKSELQKCQSTTKDLNNQIQTIAQERLEAIASLKITQRMMDDASNKIEKLEKVITGLKLEKDISLRKVDDIVKSDGESVDPAMLEEPMETVDVLPKNRNNSGSKANIEAINSLKVVELKKILKKRGLSTKGKKAELLSCLRNDMLKEENESSNIYADKENRPFDVFSPLSVSKNKNQISKRTALGQRKVLNLR